MKYSLHGFISISKLIDNTKDVDSPLGELSDLVRTYALDKGYYTKEQYPNVRLISFRSKEDDADVEVPLSIRDTCIKLGDWLYRKGMDGTFTASSEAAQQAILAELQSEITNVKTGKMVISKGVYLPSFVEFELVNKLTYESTLIKLWLSDSAFKKQYPFHEILVVPITENIDDFFLDYANVSKLKVDLDLAKIHEKANLLKGKSPYTTIRTLNYTWTKNTKKPVSIPWTILIYGDVADNMDIIRNSLANWILSNSTHSREEWMQVFPDIFVPTEFIIAPVWTTESVPGYRMIASMYSPSVPLAKVLPFAKEAIPRYTDENLSEKGYLTSSLYKSLQLFIVGNSQNRYAPADFYQLYPQYALIHSRSEDFNRIDTRTQVFIEMLTAMILQAESMSPETELPPGYAKVTRDNILYLSKSHENIDFLMTAKCNYTKPNGLTGIKLEGTRE